MQAEKEVLQVKCRAAEANSLALKKQTEGLQLEYDRLLSDNDSLRAQLAVFDRKYASTKKGL